jgi:hypothetical protein
VASRIAVALAVVGLAAMSCQDLGASRATMKGAAEEYQAGDAAALCGRFDPVMLEEISCAAMERMLRQTAAVVGAPVGECSAEASFKVQSFRPLKATGWYRCPFANDQVRLTFTAEVKNHQGRITGLWAESPRLKQAPMLIGVELARTVDERKGALTGPAEEASWAWPRIYIWTSWQNLKTSDLIAIKFIDPEGRAVAAFDHHPKTACYRWWAWIEPASLSVNDPLGDWTAAISINGNEVESYSFKVTR